MAIDFMLLGGIGYLVNQVNQSSKLDEQSMKKNIKAATKMVEAEMKVEQAQKHLIERLHINATRKNAILNCHFKLFQEQYSVIRKIEFRKGKGILQLEQVNSITQQLTNYVSQPAVASGAILKDSQQLVIFALKGIGGLLIHDSKQSFELAKRNMAQANAIAAQADAICIAYDGIANHIDIITDLLQDLGALYIRSLKQIEKILNKNGTIADNYSNEEIDTIYICVALTKLIYKIIDTPVINDNGEIEKASLNAISGGRELLDKINGGKI